MEFRSERGDVLRAGIRVRGLAVFSLRTLFPRDTVGFLEVHPQHLFAVVGRVARPSGFAVVNVPYQHACAG